MKGGGGRKKRYNPVKKQCAVSRAAWEKACGLLSDQNFGGDALQNSELLFLSSQGSFHSPRYRVDTFDKMLDIGGGFLVFFSFFFPFLPVSFSVQEPARTGRKGRKGGVGWALLQDRPAGAIVTGGGES